jgi:hypothetical protein
VGKKWGKKERGMDERKGKGEKKKKPLKDRQ